MDELASCQQANKSKTDVVFSKAIPEHLRSKITETLDIRDVLSHEKYLVLPPYVGWSKHETFMGIKDLVAKKFHEWSEKIFLGPGGSGHKGRCPSAPYSWNVHL